MGNNSAVAVRPGVASVEAVQSALMRDDRQQQLLALLGESIDPDRFRAVVLNTMVRNPDLQLASLESVLDAIRVSATLRLEPTGILGEGYILKYGNTAQFEAGYRGLMKLARRSGMVSAMDAQVVYERDRFDIQLGTEPRIDHQPTVEGERGNYRGVYAWARLTTGELVIEWMTDPDVQAVRKVSRYGTAPSSPWVNHYGEMARKTVLKRLMKRLPLGADAEYALRYEAEQDATATPEPVRRPSAAIRTIHERLGIPATVDIEQTGTAAPVEPPGAESAPVPGGIDEPVPTPASDVPVELPPPAPGTSDTKQCTSLSDPAMPPIERCRLFADHKGAHRAQGMSWPQK